MKHEDKLKILQSIYTNIFIKVYIIDLELETILEYTSNDDTTIPIPYDTFLQELTLRIPYIQINPFVQQMSLASLKEALIQNPSYSIFYEDKQETCSYCYQLSVSYLDSSKKTLILTKQDQTASLQSQISRVSALQRDSERFRFIISNMCENFGEINAKTGETWMTTSNNWEVEKGTLKSQIAWFADNIIVSEEKEMYRQDFELEQLLQTLHANNGYYAPTYRALYPDGIRHLMIINALICNPTNPS